MKFDRSNQAISKSNLRSCKGEKEKSGSETGQEKGDESERERVNVFLFGF